MKYSKLLISIIFLLFSLNVKADICIQNETDIYSSNFGELLQKECPVAITTIPSLLGKKKWFLAQKLMNHWFQGTRNDYILELSDLTKINPKLDDKINELALKAKNNTLLNNKMKENLIKEIKATNPDFINGGRGTFDHIGTEFSLLGDSWLTVKEENKKVHYIASPSVGEDGLNKYGAAIGRSNLRIVASGSYENNTIHVSRIGFYIRDSYDFSTEPQFLGCWSKSSPYVRKLSIGFDYRCVWNSDFRNWGQFHYDNKAYGDFRIFTNMREFETNQVFHYVSNPEAHFNGTGSVVAPSQTRTIGGDQDIVALQEGSNSMGSFQWYQQENYCPNLLIKNDDDSNEVDKVLVIRKNWSNSKILSSFETTLPFSLASKQNNSYDTILIKSLSPLTEKNEIRAICSDNSSYSFRKTITNPNFITKDGYTWAGNGSIISQSLTGDGIGKTEDYAYRYNDKKSLTIFQWQPSDRCKKLKISASYYDDGFYTGMSFNGKLSTKVWKLDTYIKDKETVSFPYTLSGTIGEYYMIEIRTDETMNSAYEYLYAECRE